MGDSSEKVVFKYVCNENYSPEYVNGALGGLNPTGDLIINFFADSVALPEEQVNKLNEKGDFVEVKEEPETLCFRREIKGGFVMTAPVALNIYNWLKNNLIAMGVSEDEL